MNTVYEKIQEANIPTDHHESDLYVLATPESKAILERANRSLESFISQIDHKMWYNVAFAYDPFWKMKPR